jgi:hypothetical protein
MLDDLAAATNSGAPNAEGVADVRRMVDLMEAIRAAAARPVARM